MSETAQAESVNPQAGSEAQGGNTRRKGTQGSVLEAFSIITIPTLVWIIGMSFCVPGASQAKKIDGLNLYGRPLSTCASGKPGSGEGDACTYRSYDRGAHQICVGQLPQGFSKHTGQGMWSDDHTGSNWCICIWAYANYLQNHGPIDIQCDAIPEEVLISHYSLEKFKAGGQQFLQAVDTLCDTCATQAIDSESAAVLKTRCAAMRRGVTGDGNSTKSSHAELL